MHRLTMHQSHVSKIKENQSFFYQSINNIEISILWSLYTGSPYHCGPCGLDRYSINRVKFLIPRVHLFQRIQFHLKSGIETTRPELFNLPSLDPQHSQWQMGFVSTATGLPSDRSEISTVRDAFPTVTSRLFWRQSMNAVFLLKYTPFKALFG